MDPFPLLAVIIFDRPPAISCICQRLLEYGQRRRLDRTDRAMPRFVGPQAKVREFRPDNTFFKRPLSHPPYKQVGVLIRGTGKPMHQTGGNQKRWEILDARRNRHSLADLGIHDSLRVGLHINRNANTQTIPLVAGFRLTIVV